MQEKDVIRSMNSESNDDVDLNIDNTMNTEQGVKVVGKSSRSLSFCERRKNLSPHHCPLKKQMKDKTISYIDLF